VGRRFGREYGWLIWGQSLDLAWVITHWFFGGRDLKRGGLSGLLFTSRWVSRFAWMESLIGYVFFSLSSSSSVEEKMMR